MNRTKLRNPAVIIFGALGIWVVVHLADYAGFGLGAWFSGRPIVELLSDRFKSPATLIGQGLGALLLGVPLAFVALRYIWRRTLVDTGLIWQSRSLFLGIALGLLLPPVILLIMYILGARVILAWNLSGSSLGMALVGQLLWSFFVALLEEIVFRGIIFRELLYHWHWWPAALVSGAAFSFAHLVAAIGQIKPFIFISTFLSIMLASLLFCALYSAKRNLWLPIGFHWAWNIVLTSLLGVCMSNQDQSFAILKTQVSGPAWLIGGWFGLEISLVTLVVYLALAYWLWRSKRFSRVKIPD